MTFSCEPIADVEYYYAMGRDAAQAAGCSPHEIDAEGNLRDYVNYLGPDNGAGDDRGTWLNLHHGGSPVPVLLLLRPGAQAGLLDVCVHGAPANGVHLRALSRGIDPRTLDYGADGNVISTSGKRVYHARTQNGAIRDPGGYDLQMAPPKDVSVIGLTGSLEERQAFTTAHREAYEAALRWAWGQGYFATRKVNPQTGRVEHVPVAEAALATFTHFTSRENDPHIHNHTAIMKTALDRAGNVCSLDNYLLRKHGGAIVAIYRTELVARLRRIWPYAFVRDGADRDGRNFRIEGFPDPVRALFSKRRAQVVAELQRTEQSLGVPLETATNRAAAQMASYNSRANKEFIPIEQLVAKWRNELEGRRWARESVITSMAAAARLETDLHLDDPVRRRDHMRSLVLDEVRRSLTDSTTLTEPRLLRAAGEALQTMAEGAGEIMEVLGGLKREKALVKIAEGPEGAIWTTQSLLEKELGMLRSAAMRRAGRTWVSPKMIEATLTQRPGLTAEQASAVRHVLNDDGLAIVQGLTGKSKPLVIESVIAAWKEANPETRVWFTEPPREGSEAMARDWGGPAASMAVPEFLSAYGKGEIGLKGEDLFILNGADSVDLYDYSRIVEIVGQHGMKLIAFGEAIRDHRARAGTPFYALQRIFGVLRVGGVRPEGRTDDERDWMGAASVDLAMAGNGRAGATAVQRAIEAYDRAGKIIWVPDTNAALVIAIEKYLQHRMKRPTESGAIITERSKDVSDLTTKVRALLIGEGLLSEHAVEVLAIPRGLKKAIRLELRVGDEVAFGETIHLPEGTIHKGDTGRILALIENSDDPEDPTLTVRLVKGCEFTARLSNLVGDREAGQPRAPKMQYHYCMTCYDIREASVDYVTDLHLRARGANGTYVGATRHRSELDIVVACDRIGAEPPLLSSVHKLAGRERAPKEAGESGQMRQIARSIEIKRHFYKEIGRADRTGNLSDYLSDDELSESLGIQSSQVTREPTTSVERLKVRLNERQTAPEGYAAQWTRTLRKQTLIAQSPSTAAMMPPPARILRRPAQALVSRLARPQQTGPVAEDQNADLQQIDLRGHLPDGLDNKLKF